jgi:hypothetical protein
MHLSREKSAKCQLSSGEEKGRNPNGIKDTNTRYVILVCCTCHLSYYGSSVTYSTNVNM